MSRFTVLQTERWKDHGLLFARVGLGVMFVGHGWGKLTEGPERWARLGKAMSNFGIDFGHTFWGFMGAFAEVGGGVLLAVGFLTRPALAMLACTMVVAAVKHLAAGDPFSKWSHATEAGIMFVALFLIGPGRFSLDRKLFGPKSAD